MLFHGVPLECINNTAVSYQIPAPVILTVMRIEGGHNGQIVKNKNGTYDLGVMQVNSTWIARFNHRENNQMQITVEELRDNPCKNVEVGGYILATAMAGRAGWQGIADYHSHTEKFNKIYREKLQLKYQEISDVISNEGAKDA